MNVEIGTEAAQFPEKEFINGIAVAVHAPMMAKGNVYYRGLLNLVRSLQ
jgi:hypothetical protein